MTDKPNIDGLRDEIQSQITDLLNAHVDTIGHKLAGADDGKGGFAVSCKLTLVAGKAFVESTLSFSEKFKDTIESKAIKFTDPDPMQVKIKEVES
jgi:hypothetical protein